MVKCIHGFLDELKLLQIAQFGILLLHVCQTLEERALVFLTPVFSLKKLLEGNTFFMQPLEERHPRAIIQRSQFRA